MVAMVPSAAFAWDFGRRVKGPEYLDPYLYGFGVLTAIAYVVVAMTKPKGVPFNQMYRTRLTGMAKVAFRTFQVTGAGFIAVLMGGAFFYHAETGLAQSPASEPPRLIQRTAGELNGQSGVQVPQAN